MSTESICAVNCLPPRDAVDVNGSVKSAATSAASTSTDLWAGYTADPSGNKTPPGKIWVEFEAVGFDVFFHLNTTATTNATTSNTSVLKVGVPRQFYLDPTKDLFIDHISPGGVGIIKWRKVGPIGERARA
jgi:hypothetical protein